MVLRETGLEVSFIWGFSERYVSQKSRLFYEAGQAQGVALIYGARLRLQRIRLEREDTVRCQALGAAS